MGIAEVLTKEQIGQLRGYAQLEDGSMEILGNGKIGYCKETNTIVTCCRNCGDYTHVKLDNK